MSDESDERPRRTPFESLKHVVPRKFQAKLYFQIDLLNEALDSLEELRDETEKNDSTVFQESFRFLAAMHFFMGGQFFVETLSLRTGLPATDLRYWMNGHGAPAPSVRIRVMTAAMKLIDHLKLFRQAGASLSDIVESDE